MDLTNKLEELKEKGEGAHMPHVYYGDPSTEFSDRLIRTMVDNGADIIELGIPFSDPTADGPTFIAACERALSNNITPLKCLEGIKKLRSDGIRQPIVVTSYYNILYVSGVGKFLKEIKEAGAQAIIVPNLPIEEAATLIQESSSLGIHPIFQVTPTTTGERLTKICEASSGFIYVINVEGVTGIRNRVNNSTLKLIKSVRSHTDTPILAGFGISKPEHAKALVKAGADGVIVGSMYASLYEKHIHDPYNSLPQISELVRQIKISCIEGVAERTSEMKGI